MYITFHRAKINLRPPESRSFSLFSLIPPSFETCVIISPHARQYHHSHRPHFSNPGQPLYMPSKKFRAHANAYKMICMNVYLCEGEKERGERSSSSWGEIRNITVSQTEDSVGHYATKLGRCINLWSCSNPHSGVRPPDFSERRGKDGNMCLLLFSLSPAGLRVQERYSRGCE